MHALILAGGGGTRLWPLSRRSFPKQFHSLIGTRSLIQETVHRMSELIPIEKVRIVTGPGYAQQVIEHLPDLDRSQVIVEPFQIGTNLAIGLGLIHLANEDPEALVLIGWSDAHIASPRNFLSAVKGSVTGLDTFDGIILGARPTYPANCYGYIEFDDGAGISPIRSFREKPSRETAGQLLASGDYLWNTGISLWRVNRLLELMEKHTPEHFAALMQVRQALGTGREQETMVRAFSDLAPIPVDRAIFEKAGSLGTIPVEMGWSDIGSWSALYDVKLAGNERVTSKNVIEVDTSNCLISSSQKMIAAFGVEDLVVIETDDVILIARKSKTDDLKMIHREVLDRTGDRFA